MPDTMKECRCGRRIPNDWNVCGTCERIARLDALDGSAEHRWFRHHALKQARWPNRAIEPPIDADTLALMADGIAKRSQEQSLLGLRKLNRQHHDQRIRLKHAD